MATIVFHALKISCGFYIFSEKPKKKLEYGKELTFCNHLKVGDHGLLHNMYLIT